MKRVLSAITLAACLVGPSASAALVITEVASTSGAPGTLAMLDWWELSNSGPGSVLLDGYAWEDSPVSNDRAVFPNGITIPAGESIIVHQGTGATVANDFRTTWNLTGSVQVLTQAQFTGPNPFSGLSASGDEVHLFNALNVDIANVAFGGSTSGVTFEWNRAGASLGLSANGQNGAYLSNYGGVGSPGTSVVPEPGSLCLFILATLRLRYRRRA